MKTLGTVCFALIVSALSAGGASAQMGRIPSGGIFASRGLSGLWHPVVGTAASYEVKDTRDQTTRPFEFAIINQQTIQGKNAVWVEMTVAAQQLGTVVAKELVFFDPVKLQLQTFKGVVQVADRPPMELPEEMLHEAHPFQFDDARADSQDLGKESITTPAGTFSCEHYKKKDGSADFWVSESVVPIGLVKSVEKGQTVTLVKTVTNATDKITGAVQPFDPMMFMPQNPR